MFLEHSFLFQTRSESGRDHVNKNRSILFSIDRIDNPSAILMAVPLGASAFRCDVSPLAMSY